MASPTRWLRKNSKIIMVFVAVFAMAIFGLGPVVDQLTTGGRDRSQPVNETVASWRGGKITQADIATWYRKHYQLQNFLTAVSDQGRAIAGDDFKPLAQMLPRLQSGDRAPQSMVNVELIQKFLLAQGALDEGVIIGDGVVDAYIDMISGAAGFSKNDLMQINRNVNQRVSLESIYSQLKLELAAQQMRNFSYAGYHQIPNPTEAAELYQKYTEAIELEIYPLNVDSFIEQTPTPSESELKALFEKGRYEFADPTGKRPGFKKPNELAIQFVFADFDTILTNHLNRLTDEEVQAEYERLVEEKSSIVVERIPKRKSEESLLDLDDQAPVLPGDNEADQTGDAEAEEQSGGNEQTGEGGGNATENADGSSDQGGSTSEGGNTEGGSAANDANSSQRESADDLAENETELSTEGDLGPSLQFVSFRQDESTGSSQTQENTDDPPQTEDPPQTDAPPQTGETQADPAQTPVPTAPLDQDLDAILEQIRSQQGESLFADDQEFEERVLPLVDVVDRVKRSMVADKVRIEMTETMEQALSELIDYNIQISVWESLDNKQALDKPSLDVRELATRFGLVYDEIPLSDLEALQKTDFGQISFAYQDELGRFQSTSLAELIFFQFDQKKEFDPERADDMFTRNSYIFWITEKQPAKVVTFEQAKERVEAFWRMQKALELAVQQAESKAAEANAKGQFLSEIFGEGASRTGEFTWISLAGGGQFGEPFGVDSPGEEFMKAAFALQPKQAGVAINANRSKVYVVQMVGERRTIEELGTDFIENRMMTMRQVPFETQRAASIYIQESYFDWDRKFRDQMGLRLEQ